VSERANDLAHRLGGGRRRDREQTRDDVQNVAGGGACLSDLALDRLLLGEMGAEDVATANLHLGGCARCTDARDALAADRARFASEANVAGLAADALARASRGRLETDAHAATHPSWQTRWLLRWLPALGLGAAVAAVTLLVPRAAREPAPLGDLRAKGALSLALFVKSADSAPGADGALHLGEQLHPGDRVRMQISSDRPGHLAVLALDTTGRVQLYAGAAGAGVPGPPTPVVRPGQPELLPGAVELDETLGREVIVALRCDEALPADHLVAALQRAVDQSKVASDPAAALGRSGLPCAEARYVITKTANTPAGKATRR
jgi:hypothetical protein